MNSPLSGSEKAQGFNVTPQNIESGAQVGAAEKAPHPTVNESDSILRGMTDVSGRMNTIQTELRELMAAMKDGSLSADEKIARLLNVQIGAQSVTQHWELISKTIELGTNSVNTLARTQT